MRIRQQHASFRCKEIVSRVLAMQENGAQPKRPQTKSTTDYDDYKVRPKRLHSSSHFGRQNYLYYLRELQRIWLAMMTVIYKNFCYMRPHLHAIHWGAVSSIQFNSNCPTQVTSGKKLSQCSERVFKQKRFQFTLENVRVCYFLNCMGQAVPSFVPSTGKTAFAKLHPSWWGGRLAASSLVDVSFWIRWPLQFRQTLIAGLWAECLIRSVG